jgi:hypothetical protein
MAFSEDGKYLAVNSTAYRIDHTKPLAAGALPPKGIMIFDLSSGQEIILGDDMGQIDKLFFSPNNKYLVASHLNAHASKYEMAQLAVWEMSSQRKLTLPTTEGINEITFSLDSSHIWLGGGTFLDNQRDLRTPFLLDWDLTQQTVKHLSSPELVAVSINDDPRGGTIWYLEANSEGGVVSGFTDSLSQTKWLQWNADSTSQLAR